MIGNQIRMHRDSTSHAQIDTIDCQARDMLLRGRPYRRCAGAQPRRPPPRNLSACRDGRTRAVSSTQRDLMAARTTEDSADGEAFRPEVPAPPTSSEAGGAVEHPDLAKLGEALRDRVEVRSIAITGLLVLAVLYTLYFARAFFLPIVLAVLLDFLLSPLVRTLKRARIPEPVGAALVILTLLGAVGFGG